MKIDLNRSDGSITGFELDIEANDVDLESDFARVNGRVISRGTVANEETHTVVEAEVEAPLFIDCSRCLKEIPLQQQLSFRTAFVCDDGLSDDQEVELDLRDLELSFSDEDEVDLVDVIREQIMLSLPAHPLCKEDCKGLCEICGSDRNQVNCDCKTEETDPRWAALKDLK